MRATKQVTIAFAAIMTVPLVAAAGQPSAADRLLAPFAACAGLAETVQRSACYDRAYMQLRGSIANGEVSIADAAQRREKFGLRAIIPHPLRKAREEKAGSRVAEPDTIETTVRSVSEATYDQLVIALENGAEWRTTDADNSFFIRPGAKVRLRQGALGSYWLDIIHGRSARVVRVR